MNRQHVELVDANQSVNEAVGRVHDLADQRIVEFRNHSTGCRESDQAIRHGDEAGDDDRGVVR
jgi:hypothetical protein